MTADALVSRSQNEDVMSITPSSMAVANGPIIVVELRSRIRVGVLST